MLSSISSSNYKVKITLLLGLSIVTYFLLNAFAFHLLKQHYAALEDQDVYIRTVKGMNDLMQRQYPVANLDVIFVGSSTTKVQIDSSIMQAQNMRVFNYSLLGYTISQYPAMVRNAIKQKPKVIVISIKEPELFVPTSFFYDHYYHQLDLKWSSLKYLAKHVKNRDDYRFLRKLTLSYFGAKNYFGLYGYKVTDLIKSQYEKHGKLAMADNTNPDALPLSFCSYPHTATSAYDDCNNGDLKMDGISEAIKYDYFGVTENHPSKNYNYTFASMFNGLIDEIKAAGIRPVVIFIPEFSHHVYEDDTLMQKTLHADIIDLSNITIPKEGWYNEEHLNGKGREIYSQKVAEVLKPIVVEAK